MNTSTLRETRLFVDAHVHFYDCFSPCSFFNSAFYNLSSLSEKGNESSAQVLLLTETARESGFLRLLEASKNPAKAVCKVDENWYCYATGEPDSVILKTRSGKVLYVIAGKQIVTREGLEVHALATNVSFEDGKPLQGLLDEIRSSGGVAAMPWGTGKWLGRRGGVMKSMCGRFSRIGILLSDSGIRPWIWPESKLYKSGPRVIAGTDPLPIPAEAFRTGSFGFTVLAQWDQSRPAQSMRSVLVNRELEITRFGRSQGVWQFLSRQIAIRTAVS